MQHITICDLNGHEAVFELNGSAAAAALLAQMPLEIEVDNFSNNEKIFYPPKSLTLENTPLAAGGAGTLAYYAPWGNAVMFYGSYRPNSELYALGRAVRGAEQIKSMSGMLTIKESK